MVTIQTNAGDFKRELDRQLRTAIDAAEDAVEAEARQIYRMSKRDAPKDTGKLKDSAFHSTFRRQGNFAKLVGFKEDYAFWADREEGMYFKKHLSLSNLVERIRTAIEKVIRR